VSARAVAVAIAIALLGAAALAIPRLNAHAAKDADAGGGRPRRFDWPRGRRDVYAVRWVGTSRRQLPGSHDDAEPKELGGGARFDGDVTVRSLGPEADGAYTLVYGLAHIRDYGASLDGNELVSDGDRQLAIAALTGQEAIVRVDARGVVGSIAYHHDTPPSTRELLRQVVGMMRVTLPDDVRATSWTAQEATPNGVARVRYEDEGDVLRRVRLSYRGIPGLDAAGGEELEQELSSAATIELDERGSLRALEDTETLRARGSAGALFSHWEFRAKRTSSGAFEAKEVKIDDTDEATGAAQLARERQRGRDERLAVGWDTGAVEVQLEVYGKGAHIDPRFVPVAAAYVRLHPEACAHLVAWFDDPRLTDLGRQLVLDVLSAAGSDEAQAAMRDALNTKSARDPGLRGALVQRFLFVADPTPESARFVSAVYESSRAAGERGVAFRAAAALGAIVEHMTGSDALAGEIDRRLRTELAERRSPEESVALLLALGNARQEEDLGAIEAFAGDAQPAVREQVARSLRRFDDPIASAALLGLVRDPSPAVTRAALRALREQSLGDDEWESLARAVEETEPTPRGSAALVDLLERRPDCGAARAARMLHAVLDRTPDTGGNRELRERAARLLAEPTR
jgi:hypothetical protein